MNEHTNSRPVRQDNQPDPTLSSREPNNNARDQSTHRRKRSVASGDLNAVTKPIAMGVNENANTQQQRSAMERADTTSPARDPNNAQAAIDGHVNTNDNDNVRDQSKLRKRNVANSDPNAASTTIAPGVNEHSNTQQRGSAIGRPDTTAPARDPNNAQAAIDGHVNTNDNDNVRDQSKRRRNRNVARSDLNSRSLPTDGGMDEHTTTTTTTESTTGNDATGPTQNMVRAVEAALAEIVGYFPDGELPTLEWALMQRIRHCCHRLVAIAEALADADLVVRGSMGQQRAHPLLKTEETLRKEMALALERLSFRAANRAEIQRINAITRNLDAAFPPPPPADGEQEERA